MKYLSPLEFAKEHSLIQLQQLDNSDWLILMQKYHDYALDMAADKGRLEVQKNGQYDGVCDTYGHTDKYNDKYVLYVNRQSILSLKLTNTK